MRVKRKKKNNVIYIIISIVIFILFVTTGYSLLSDSLNISGYAKTDNVVSGNKLLINLIQSGGRYTTASTTASGANFQSEVLNENVLTVNYIRTTSNAKLNNLTLTINFTNPYVVSMQNGVSSYSIISGTTFSAISTSLSKTTLAPNESGSFTLRFSYVTKGAANPSTIRSTIQYTSLGITQYFYLDFVLN